jgi:hypothetical protein
MEYSELINRIQVLTESIGVFKSRIQEHDTGHLYTTISTLEDYIEELEKQVKTLDQ